MFLICLSFVLIAAIAFWQVRLGAFSALITLILASLSAVIAFNYYEALALWFDTDYMLFAQGGAMIGLFVVVQIALRFVFDLLVSSDIGFAMWPNRIIGGALGILVGMVQVGVFMIAMQMLPISQSVFTYVPFKDDLSPRHSLAPFYPDRFVVGIVKTFSEGSLRVGDDANAWSRSHPDLLKELFARRNFGWDTADDGGLRAKRGEARVRPDSLLGASVHRLMDQKILNDLPVKSTDVSSGEFYVVRARVAHGVRDSKDENSGEWFRLAGTQFALTARVPGGRAGVEEFKNFYPVAFLTTSDKKSWAPPVTRIEGNDQGLAQPGRLVVERDYAQLADKDKLTVDWVYLLPGNATPHSLTFRGASVQKFTVADKEKDISKTLPSPADALERKTN